MTRRQQGAGPCPARMRAGPCRAGIRGGTPALFRRHAPAIFAWLALFVAVAGCAGEKPGGAESNGGRGNGGSAAKARTANASGSPHEGQQHTADDELAGVWQVVDRKLGQKKVTRRVRGNVVQVPVPRMKPILKRRDRITFSGGRVTVAALDPANGGGKLMKYVAATYSRTVKPGLSEIDFNTLERTEWLVRGVYALEGDTLRLCVCQPGYARPGQLEVEPGDGNTLYVLERVAPVPPTEGRPGSDDEAALAALRQAGAEAEPGSEGNVEALAVSEQLDGESFTDAALVHLKGLPSLRRLDLRGSRVTDEGLKHVAGLLQLEELVLDGLPITDEGLAAIGKLERLQRLSLRGTRVSDTGLIHLHNLRYLHVLVLTDTDVSFQGVRPLRQVLPHAVILLHDRPRQQPARERQRP